jgi:multimeric flavodoxin WrbA
MKVLALNSSPKSDKGNTALILDPFLEGMTESGAEVELCFTKKLDVKPCQGELNCWLKSPGNCFQDDDMHELRPKFARADVWVFATPLYVDGMAGPLKNVIDRLIPLADPFIELRDDHCRHAQREGVASGKIVLVSNCGFWERDNFDPLVAHVQAICRNTAREFAGALLRPHGPAVGAMKAMGQPPSDVLEAAREAGRQLATRGRMDPATLEAVARDLMPRDAYVEVVNRRFREAMARGEAGSRGDDS